MNENDVARLIVNAAFTIHVQLGPGLMESVYETVLAHDLETAGLTCARQSPIPIRYNGISFDEGFRADLLLNDLVIVELKSVENLSAVHAKQLNTYLTRIFHGWVRRARFCRLDRCGRIFGRVCHGFRLI